ncbi:MAG: hypothetical protein ACK5MF_15380 [Vibrio sp.]|uniref:hypothetical protein n=1 Tax=Vibrio sp. TaxID=678 RepID=UPI003A8933DE
MANMIFLDALNYQADTPLEKCIVLYWAKGCNSKGLIAEQKPIFSIETIAAWCGAEFDDVFDSVKALHEKAVLIDISGTSGTSDPAPIWKLNFKGAL